MNKRIKELALEAFQPINDVTTEGVADRRTFDQAWFQHYNEKFAELIVKECIATVKKRYMGDNNREDMEVRRCVADIQTHFGVEEE